MRVQEFAERKRVSKQAVLKGIRSGRLGASVTRLPDGSYDLDVRLADLEWETNANPARRPAKVADPEAAPDFAAAKARREAALAAMAEDELKRRRGQLIEVAGLERRLVEVFTACKTKLLALPTRARQDDPTLTGPQVALFDRLIREALEDLANGAPPAQPEAAPETPHAAPEVNP